MWFYIKIISALAIAISFFCLPIYYYFARKDLINNLECINQENSELIIVIVDASDPYDNVDAGRVIKEIRDMLSNIKKSSRFVIIYPNQNNPYSPNESIIGCINSNLSKSSYFIMSEEERANYTSKRDMILKKVSDEVSRILRNGPSRLSPLLETLIAISKRYDFRKSEKVKIVMYSDMEQNSNAISVYPKTRQGGESYKISLEEISLQNVQIVVKRIVRRTKIGKFEGIKKMWDEWFFKTQAQVVWEK